MKIKQRLLASALSIFAALLLGITASAQQQPVKGTLRSTTNEPLPGATVTVKGTNRSVVTDESGNFTIDAPPGSTLVITNVGYQDREVRVSGSGDLSVALEAKDDALNEVVVTGYTAQRKGSLTGAISTVTAKDLDRVHGGSTVSTGLAGKLPGVSFRMPDGRPGASANIQIRNMGNPLFVIDGIQQDAGQFNNLAPNDIESITVLKDASAAIYGVRAANGVVVVTTKKGKQGRNSINIDAYAGAQNWTRFAKVLNNSYDYMYYRAEAEMNRLSRTTNITPAELEKYRAGTERGYQSFDWRDFIIQKNAPQTSVNINATGGTDKVSYYLSGTNLYQNSVLGREYKFNRTNIQSNVTAQVSNSIKVGVMVNGRIETRQNPGVPGGDDYNLARFAILRNTPLERPYANDNPAYLNDIKHNETNWAYLNTTLGGKFKSDWRVLQGNFNAEYQVPFVTGLTLKGLYSYYIADLLYNNHEYTYVAYTFNPVDSTYKGTGGSTNPWREREQVKQINKSSQLHAVYNNTFGNHAVGAVFVAERILNQRLRNWIHSVPSTNVLPLIYFNTADQYNDSDDREARVGYIGRLNYSFAGKYYLEASGRRDASYLFLPGKRTGFFPSASIGWRITEEDWVKQLLGDNNFLTDLKFRASYGVLGDDAVGLAAFSYLEGYNYNQGTGILGGNAIVGSRDRGLPITNVTWLKSKITDIGMDFALLNGKLTGTFDYFYRKRTGLRAPKYDVLLPSEVGFTLPNENLNSDAQYGEEGSLNWSDKIGRLSYNVGANLSYSRARFLQSYKPVFFHSLDHYRNSLEDRYLNINWGKIVDGQFTSFEQINSWPVNIDGLGNRTLLPGDLILRDINGDGRIDNHDNRPIGYGSGTQPNINYGLTFGLAFQSFDFHADFSGAAGYTWFQENETRRPFQNDGNLNTIFLDRWHRADPFDLNSAWIPGKYPANRFNENNNNNFQTATFWGHNVKYLRARTLELGYSVPTNVLNRIKVQRARFYLNAYNLFSIDNVRHLNIDPEVTSTNGYQFPQNKFVNAGINLTL
jgi:TonB-linked SusC/RagA family outer membrane protein